MSGGKHILAGGAALGAIGALVYFYGGAETPAGQPPLARLTAQNAEAVKTAFNAAKGDVRVLALLSPT